MRIILLASGVTDLISMHESSSGTSLPAPVMEALSMSASFLNLSFLSLFLGRFGLRLLFFVQVTSILIRLGFCTFGDS